MRIKILLLGDDPVSLMADGQLLRERGMLVYTAFNLENIFEIINEVKPDIVFFDPRLQTNEITAVYNDFISSKHYSDIPAIYTLTEDDVYLVSRKRLEAKEKKNLIADTMVSAVRKALWSNKTHEKKSKKTHTINIPIPNIPARA